jgi:hypothetical protein
MGRWSEFFFMRIGLFVRAFYALIVVACCSSPLLAKPCIAPPLSDAAISQFKANPEAIIAPGSDTRTIEATVRDLTGTDATLAADFIGLAKQASPRFQTAIAAGLAQAAVACQTIDQEAALLIQQAVAAFNDGQFQDAFAAVAGDLSTAAVAAATQSANSSVGSVEIINPNKGGTSTTNPGGGGSLTVLQITSGGIAVASRSAALTRTTTSANPVSPTR